MRLGIFRGHGNSVLRGSRGMLRCKVDEIIDLGAEGKSPGPAPNSTYKKGKDSKGKVRRGYAPLVAAGWRPADQGVKPVVDRDPEEESEIRNHALRTASIQPRSGSRNLAL